MRTNVAGTGDVTASGRITLTHVAGSSAVAFASLILTFANGQFATYPLGNATIAAGDPLDRFAGTHTYTSSGCGTINVSTSGWFSGDAMNLTMILVPGFRSCERIESRGEMRR